MMEKIEELTLYIIDAKKEMAITRADSKAAIDQLKNEIQILKAKK